MKSTYLIYAICIIAGVGAFSYARADFAYVDMTTTTTNQFYRTGVVSTSTGALPGAYGGTYQPIVTPVASNQSGAYEFWKIDKIRLQTNGATTGTGTTGADDQFILSILNNVLNPIATSIYQPGAGHNLGNDLYLEWTFPSIWVGSTTTASNTPAYLKVDRDCSGSCGSQFPAFALHKNYGLPYIGSFSDTVIGGLNESYYITSNGTAPLDVKYWNGSTFVTTGDTSDSGKTYQLDFTILSSETFNDLTITYPTIQSTVTAPYTMTGTCSNAFDLYLYQGTSWDTRTDGFYTGVQCANNEWQMYSGVTYGGYWNLFITDGTNTDGTAFYVIAQSSLPTPTTTPFINEEGGDAGFWTFLFGYATSTQNLRPYSYFFEVLNGIKTALNNASGTAMFQSMSVVSTTTQAGAFTFTIPNIDNNLIDNVLPQSSWSTVKLFSTMILYLSFIFYLLYRIMRMV